MDYDVVVIGAGAGGMNSAIYASRAGMSVAIIERGLYGGQLHNTDVVENYLGFTTVGGAVLADTMESHVREQQGIDRIYGDVSAVRKFEGEFSTTLKDGNIIESKSVVVATGVKHKKLGIEGETTYDGRSLSYCATCDGAFFKNKSVAVVGGGDSAVESAIYLSNIVKDVSLVYRGDKLRAEKVLQDRMYAKDNIKVLWNAETEAVKGDNRSITDLAYLDKTKGVMSSLAVNGVFVNVGIVPVTDYLEKGFTRVLLDEQGFVRSNPLTMETPVKGLFAVGDLRQDSIRQVASAVGDGAVAGIHVSKFVEERK